MQEAGLEPMEVIVAATSNGAEALGRDDLGVVAPGHVADLLVLDADPVRDVRAFRSITHVVRAGIVHDRTSLAW